MRWLPLSLRTCAARAVHSASAVVSKRERSVALFPRSFDWFTGGEPLVKGPAVAGGAAAAISGCFSRSLQGWRARRRSRGDSPKLALLFHKARRPREHRRSSAPRPLGTGVP